jgi:predicted transcriptional regulator of viral defense system
MWAQVDTLIAELARRQHGVVEHDQLRALGLSDSAISWRVGRGRLHRLYRGVYAVGHTRLSAEGRRLAAVLACGTGAVLSHQTAAAQWGIRPSSSPVIHVTVPTTNGRRRPGIRVHRTRSLLPTDATRHDGIPITTVGRTLLDLTSSLDAGSLRKAVERADSLKLFDAKQLYERASPKLRDAIARASSAHFNSPLESDFLALVVAHGIRRPEVNAQIHGLVHARADRDRTARSGRFGGDHPQQALRHG